MQGELEVPKGSPYVDFKPQQHPRGYQWHAVGQAAARTRVQSPGRVPPRWFKVPSTPHCRHQRLQHWQGPGCHAASFLEYFPTSLFLFFVFLNVAAFSYTFIIQGLFSRTDIAPPTKLYKCPFPLEVLHNMAVPRATSAPEQHSSGPKLYSDRAISTAPKAPGEPS